MKLRPIFLNLFLIFLILVGLAYLGRHRIASLWEDWMSEPAPDPISYQDIINRRAANNTNLNTNAPPAPEPVIDIPPEFNLDVPFTTQSPYAEWTEQDNESCEEAAALIVHYYWQNKTFTKDIAKQELQSLVDYQNEHYGDYKDTDAEETAQLIRDIWGYEKVVVTYDITVEDIKKEVVQGRPVILPTAGRMLGNPNFRSPGPIYHMLAVRGWTEDMIITNDPGTRKGEEYQYTQDVLYNAIHDWNGGEVDSGRKAMIVVWPNN